MLKEEGKKEQGRRDEDKSKGRAGVILEDVKNVMKGSGAVWWDGEKYA